MPADSYIYIKVLHLSVSCAHAKFSMGLGEAIANRQTDTSSGSFCTPVCGDGFRITSQTLEDS